MYVGRLAAEKRVDVVLEAFALVRARLGDDVALVLVGDGPFAGRLRRDAPEGTHFLGYLKGVALAEAYAAGDLFVCASETETFGNVVLEAIASGVPAIVVDRGGVTETVIPGRTGVRVPPGDVVAFADACVALLENDDERSRLADGARAEALTKGWNRILDGVLDVWEDCASQAPERWPTSTEPTPASRSGSRLRVGDRSFLRGIPWILRRRAGLSLPRRPAP